MRLVFAGTPEAAVPSLRALLSSPRHEVVAVITRPDAPVGRGRHFVRSPIAALADEHGVKVFAPQRVGDPDFLDQLRELAPDCCAVVAYGALLPQRALDISRYGWINLHFSLLPAWRGAAPVQAAIRHGDTITGATTFRIVKELDAGPTYGMITETIGERDTSGDVLARLAVSGARLLVSTMDGIEDGTALAAPQPESEISYASKISVSDARVDFAKQADEIDRLVRSLTPDPGAWTEFRGERLKLGPVLPTDITDLAPGELRVTKRDVLVGTTTVAVRLTDVQAQGKKLMPATDWARGSRIEPGEQLT